MLNQAKAAAPTLFKYSGPGCVNSSCPEGKMTCGKLVEVRKKYLGTEK
jgi:thymidylate synthase (FAD)